MSKAYTNEQKHNLTKRVVVDLLQACGPCDMQEIVSEVKTQAFAGYLPKVMMELRQSLTIKYDEEDQCFEMMQ